jgi:hypothetical protein
MVVGQAAGVRAVRIHQVDFRGVRKRARRIVASADEDNRRTEPRLCRDRNPGSRREESGGGESSDGSAHGRRLAFPLLSASMTHRSLNDGAHDKGVRRALSLQPLRAVYVAQVAVERAERRVPRFAGDFDHEAIGESDLRPLTKLDNAAATTSESWTVRCSWLKSISTAVCRHYRSRGLPRNQRRPTRTALPDRCSTSMNTTSSSFFSISTVFGTSTNRRW